MHTHTHTHNDDDADDDDDNDRWLRALLALRNQTWKDGFVLWLNDYSSRCYTLFFKCALFLSLLYGQIGPIRMLRTFGFLRWVKSKKKRITHGKQLNITSWLAQVTSRFGHSWTLLVPWTKKYKIKIAIDSTLAKTGSCVILNQWQLILCFTSRLQQSTSDGLFNEFFSPQQNNICSFYVRLTLEKKNIVFLANPTKYRCCHKRNANELFLYAIRIIFKFRQNSHAIAMLNDFYHP